MIDLGDSYIVYFVFGVGVLSLAAKLYQALVVFVQTFILPGTSLKKFGAGKGSWAVVTGASDGIGKEFAFQLAKAGFNIVLVARKENLLKEIATQIENKYPGTATIVHLIDFSKNDHEGFATFKSQFSELDIGVLVNNVGKSHSMPTDFVDTPETEIQDIVTININATLAVTYIVLPGMLQRKRGLILNIGSFAGSVPSPMLATYSGTKAFLATFSDALAEEVKSSHVLVQHLNTYFVVSKLSKIRKSAILVPEPSAYVRSALSKIGLECGAVGSGRTATSTPFWSHAVLDYLIHLIGVPHFVRYTHRLHKDIRRRALAKAKRAS